MQGAELKHAEPSPTEEASLEGTEAHDLDSIHPNKCLSEDPSVFQNHPKNRSRSGRGKAKRLLLQMLLTSALTQPAEAYTPHQPHTTPYTPQQTLISQPEMCADKQWMQHRYQDTRLFSPAFQKKHGADLAYCEQGLASVIEAHGLETFSYADPKAFQKQRHVLTSCLDVLAKQHKARHTQVYPDRQLKGSALIKQQLKQVGWHMPSGVVLYDLAQNHKQHKAVKQYYEKKGLKERFEKELKAYRKASKRWGRVLRVKEEEVRDSAEDRALVVNKGRVLVKGKDSNLLGKRSESETDRQNTVRKRKKIEKKKAQPKKKTKEDTDTTMGFEIETDHFIIEGGAENVPCEQTDDDACINTQNWHMFGDGFILGKGYVVEFSTKEGYDSVTLQNELDTVSSLLGGFSHTEYSANSIIIPNVTASRAFKLVGPGTDRIHAQLTVGLPISKLNSLLNHLKNISNLLGHDSKQLIDVENDSGLCNLVKLYDKELFSNNLKVETSWKFGPKKGLSIMSRVALSSLYDNLPSSDKNAFKDCMSNYLNTDIGNSQKREHRVLKGYNNDDTAAQSRNINDPNLTLQAWYNSIIDEDRRQSLRDENDTEIKQDLLSPPPGFHWTNSYTDNGIRRYGMGGITNYNVLIEGNIKLDKIKKTLLEIRKYVPKSYTNKDTYIDELKGEIRSIGAL